MSYNSLLTDPDLVARWNGDADGDGTGDANNAANPGTYDGTWTGTAAYSTPPYGDGKEFNGSATSYITLPAPFDPTADFTVFCVWKYDSVPVGVRGMLSQNDGTGVGRSIVYSNSGSVITFLGNTATDSDFDLSAGVRAKVGLTNNAGTLSFYINGALGGSGSPTIEAADGSLLLGAAKGGSSPSELDSYDLWLLSRALILSEHGELNAGPEPTYTSGATLAANGAYDVGTWDAQSNGTATYEWAVVEADGTVVDSGTGATGTADFGATTGLLTLLVRASNDGGYDVGDFATRTSGYGSSGDGYYEVATVAVPIVLPVSPVAYTATFNDATLTHTISARTIGRLDTIRRPLRVHTIRRPLKVHTISAD